MELASIDFKMPMLDVYEGTSFSAVALFEEQKPLPASSQIFFGERNLQMKFQTSIFKTVGRFSKIIINHPNYFES